MTASKKWTGDQCAHARKVTPEVLAMMVDLLPTIGSLRDLCAVTGLRLDVVRHEMAPFLALMKILGTHPQCGCGQDRFHPYGCHDNWAKSRPSDCLPGHTREQTVALLLRREQAIQMLVMGCRQVDIDKKLGMPKGGAKNYLRFLTPAQLSIRKQIAAERPKLDPERPSSIREVLEPKRPFRCRPGIRAPSVSRNSPNNPQLRKAA